MATNPNAVGATDSIGLQAFLNILTKQLTYQDPLKPMDNQEFIAQMATFAGLEQTRQLSLTTEQAFKVQSTSTMVGMLGKAVEVDLPELDGAAATVTGVGLIDGVARLTVEAGGKSYSNITLEMIKNVKNP